jgi:malonate transporter and related proteins
MRSLVEVVAPVFAIIALGWLAARRGWVEEAGFRGLNWLIFHITGPALLFAGGTAPGDGGGGGGGAALAFFLGTAALYAGGLWFGRAALGQDLGAAGMFALNITFGNSVMMGIPLMAAAYGPEGLAVFFGILALHSLVLLGVATVVAEIAQQARAAPWRHVFRVTVRGVVRNPVVMAVAAALLWRALDLPVPGVVRRTLDLLGAATPAVALFCLGGSLAGFAAAVGAWREAALASALKLLAMPLLVWLAARALGLGPLETAVAVVGAALPTGANAFLLAHRYRIGAERTGAVVLVSTAVSVVTLAVLLAVFPRP